MWPFTLRAKTPDQIIQEELEASKWYGMKMHKSLPGVQEYFIYLYVTSKRIDKTLSRVFLCGMFLLPALAMSVFWIPRLIWMPLIIYAILGLLMYWALRKDLNINYGEALYQALDDDERAQIDFIKKTRRNLQIENIRLEAIRDYYEWEQANLKLSISNWRIPGWISDSAPLMKPFWKRLRTIKALGTLMYLVSFIITLRVLFAIIPR